MTAPIGGDTIFALSSGAPPAAIAIVRVSGPNAARALIRLAGRIPHPRQASLAALRDGSGELLDRALLLWLPGPGTATGEDLAELHLHGGKAVVAAVLSALGEIDGLRAAEPGEFTRRAFVNGRLDLTEAEGLADLLSAETEGARRQAMRQAEGGLSRLVHGWRLQLLALSARAEAQLQFGDDEGDVLPDPTLALAIEALAADLHKALAQPPAERLHDGFRVVVAGPPNAGKSTLVNALAGRDAAIVSPIAGTTRDLVEVPIILDGIGLILIDSAGLRDAGDEIERFGVERAGAAITAADLLLWLGDPEAAPRGDVITVHSKADLAVCEARSNILNVSAHTGSGISTLSTEIAHRLARKLPSTSAILLNARHRKLIDEIVLELSAAISADAPELCSEHLRVGLSLTGKMVGASSVDDMLDALFSRFCLGK